MALFNRHHLDTVIGRDLRLTPEQGHAHEWPSDLIGRRMIALSINLGPHAYEGGILELRDRPSGRVIGAAPNPYLDVLRAATS